MIENPLLDLIATTAFGLEAVVKRELADLGYQGSVVSPGRIAFRGDWSAVCRANLWLRTADRILLQRAAFAAPDFEALFENAKAADWSQWIPPDGAFPVVGRSLKSQLTSVPACQRAVKRAVVDSLQSAHQVRSLPETGGLYKIEVALLNDQATLTIDTTGPSLHKRGYRVTTTSAPLKETLAAALVLLSFWDRERPLVDPFCGSGTIPIEAAMIGRQLAPGLQRSFAAEQWPAIDPRLWQEARGEARDVAQADLGAGQGLVGSDIDRAALAAAHRNAHAAGVAADVHFQPRAFEELSTKRKFGCLITNPPYGQRLGSRDSWQEVYRSIPVVLRKLPTWSHFILTSYPDFERLVEKRADRRRKLYNGRIECTYYQFHGPKPNAGPGGAPTASDKPGEPLQPVFGGLTDKAREQAELFRTRLGKRAKHLRRWPARGITCFRIYERDIPELPLIVDRYEDHLHITEYERPHDRDLAQHADWLDLMVAAAGEALGVERSKVFFKRRQRQRGATQHDRLDARKYEITVHEGGLQFVVNLSDYVDTGLFLDHRITRSMVRQAAEGARFLNLFGYTGSFSVYAASGKAASTTTVDWSRSYLEWARRNMTLNGFTGPEHHFHRQDAREFLDSLPDRPLYDLAVVDPPTFSNSKRTDSDWSVQSGHVELLNCLLRKMSDGGVIFFSSNFRRLRLDEQAIRAAQIHEISSQTVPDDFRNRRIHRCWRIVAGQRRHTPSATPVSTAAGRTSGPQQRPRKEQST